MAQSQLHLHAVDVAREGQVAVTGGGNVAPELGDVAEGEVVGFAGYRFVDGAEVDVRQVGGVSVVAQGGVERDAAERDGVAAPFQVDRLVVQYPPPHLLLTADQAAEIGLAVQCQRVLDVDARVVVADDRVDPQRGIEPAEQGADGGVELRVADVYQVAAEEDQVGPERPDGIDQPGDLRFGAFQHADMQVGKEGDAHTVEGGGEPVGGYRDLLHA